MMTISMIKLTAVITMDMRIEMMTAFFYDWKLPSKMDIDKVIPIKIAAKK